MHRRVIVDAGNGKVLSNQQIHNSVHLDIHDASPALQRLTEMLDKKVH
jgi:hypothetical protein